MKFRVLSRKVILVVVTGSKTEGVAVSVAVTKKVGEPFLFLTVPSAPATNSKQLTTQTRTECRAPAPFSSMPLVYNAVITVHQDFVPEVGSE